MHRESEDYSLETIAKWEEGLKQVAEIWGPRSKDYSRKEDLVSALVADVVRRVKSVDMEVAKYPVAIDHRVNELHAIINNHESLDGACIVGIVGMTGIGKPTIAKRYFNLHRSSFRSSCFVGNIKQMTGEELQNTQKLLLKELALYNADHISSTDQGIKLLKKHLQGPKFLLILDDVDDHLQLKALMVHEVLSHESIILPVLLGEYLKKGIQDLTSGITKRFQSSFVDLSEMEKNVVLDIACFLEGEDKDVAISFWNSLGISSNGFMNVEYLSLVERRSNPSKMAKLNMVPSSIIWKEDGMSLLKAWPVQFFTKMRTSPIQLRVLELEGGLFSHLWDDQKNSEVPVQLRHLQLQGYENLIAIATSIGKLVHLKTLVLKDCKAVVTLPDEICNLQSLVHLNMSGCINLENLPSLFENLRYLRIPNLSGCERLGRLPDSFVNLASLVDLNLSNCRQLMTLPFGHLAQLTYLDISGCQLLDLQHPIYSRSLISLNLLSCMSFNLLPSIVQLPYLCVLMLSSRDFIKLPDRFEQLSFLHRLDIRGPELVELPFLCNLSKLKEMKLIGNSGLHLSHQCFSNRTLLEKLVLDECQVSNESFALICGSVSYLTSLELCKMSIAHVNIKGVFMNLISLSIISCPNFVEFEVSPTLRKLEIIRCPLLKIVSVPSGFSMGLRELTLRNCEELSMIQSIDELQHLEKLDTVGCIVLHYIQGLEKVKTLKELHIFITN
ncbi:hypothetical protein AMTR_s00060p00213070 [Amborella trichopoda]|uniref:NB-ARC domain-containing protein n=1 Tax=Amborella trichopoda TaxID=13333 RepID=W1NKG0_AMBTC|nr:hypothetical protein AMTR_s00060p00213070 [Amborella trichopoda]